MLPEPLGLVSGPLQQERPWGTPSLPFFVCHGSSCGLGLVLCSLTNPDAQIISWVLSGYKMMV